MLTTRSSKQSGFTLVELLIVIVVVGILAVITVIAYNGVASRASNTQTTTNILGYLQAARNYFIENGRYPGCGGVQSGFCMNACLNTNTNAICGNTANNTAACNGIGQSTYQAAFASDISTVASVISNYSSQQVSCGGYQYVGAIAQIYTTGINFYAFFSGSGPCVVISGTSLVHSAAFGNGYECQYQMVDS